MPKECKDCSVLSSLARLSNLVIVCRVFYGANTKHELLCGVGQVIKSGSRCCALDIWRQHMGSHAWEVLLNEMPDSDDGHLMRVLQESKTYLRISITHISVLALFHIPLFP